jgi:ABC-type transport system involved in cytochrome c biogenesis permease component
MVLIEFLLAGNNTEDEEFRSSENMITMLLFETIVVFLFGTTSMRDSA